MSDFDGLIRISLWTKSFARAGWIGEWDNLDVTRRAVGPAAASWTCADDVDGAAALLTPGCRATIDYRPDPSLSWTQLAAGTVVVQDSGPSRSSVLTVTLIDAWYAMNVLAWPVPTSAIGSQTTGAWTASGPGEDVITSLVTAAATRLGLPLTVPASAHRGDSITVDTRFDQVGEVVAAAAAKAGLTTGIRQVAGGLQLAVGVGADRRSTVLSEDADTVTDWQWSISPPSLTRVVVGGAGTSTGRVLTTVTDTAAEALWGIVAEGFVDAGDTVDAPTMTASGQAALDAAAARVDGLRVTLSESESWRYCAPLREGDVVRVDLIPGLPRDTTVTEVRVQAAEATGITVTPVIGDPTAGLPEREQAQIIASLARGVARLRAR